MNLPNDMCRCYGKAVDGDICQKRDNCIRHLQIAKDADGWFIYCSMLCDEDWRYWMPPKVGE